MITFEKVTKKFGEIVALKEVTFKVASGEFVFLTGHSGAGKTTIIRLLTGEYLPTSGNIEVSSKIINQIPKKKLYLWRRKIGVVFQDYKLLPDRTIFENVSLPLGFTKVSSTDLKNKVEGALNLVGLSERKNLFPSQLAGGELQRACLARAVITAPEILLADEPTGNLDPKNAQEVINLFKEINKRGTTLIMATHNREIVDLLKAE